MALKKIVNWEGGSNARYDVRLMTRNADGTYSTDGFNFDAEGRPLSGGVPGDGPGQWTPGLPGARGGSGPGDEGGGGGGGSVIPGAGTYLQEQALAQQAYERALLGLRAQRAQRQSSAGLLDDYSVNPLVQYGLYQQLLQGQGADLLGAEEGAQSRGLFGGGLGRQPESFLRYGHAIQNLGFRNQLAEWEQEYQRGIAEAEYNRQWAMLQALQGGYGNAYGDFDVGPYDTAEQASVTATTRPTGRPGSRRRRPVGIGMTGFGGGLGGAMIAQRQRAAEQRRRQQQTRAANTAVGRRLVR